MALLKFKKGSYSKLPEQRVEGTVYITTDEKAMYVDIGNNENDRIRIGQIISITSAQLTPPYSAESFYYLTDLNALVRWDKDEDKWIQLNSTDAISKRLNDLETKVGNLESTLSGQSAEITALQETISDSETGLIKQINDVAKKVDDLESIGGQVNIIEEIKVNGVKVDPVEKAVSLGKLAGVDAKVAEADLDSNLQGKINGIVAGVEAAATKTYVDGIVGADGTLTTELKNTKTDLTTEINNAKTAASTAQSAAEGAQDTADEAKGIAEGAAAAAQSNANAIQNINSALTNKVSYTDFNNVVGAEGSLTGEVASVKSIAEAARDAANTNATNISKNTTAIAGNAASIQALTNAIGNLSNVMNFRGVSTTDPDTSIVTIDGVIISGNENVEDDTVENGDVVIYDKKEYVYSIVNNKGSWVEFGDGSVNGAAISNLSDSIKALQKTVGDSTEGLVKAVSDNTNNIAAQGATIESQGNSIQDLMEAMTWGKFE